MAAFIFDLDGTLINSLADLAEAMNVTLKKLGYPTHPDEAYQYFVGDGLRELVVRALPEGEATEEAVEKVSDGFNRYYDAHYLVHTKVYPGIPELLQELKGKGAKLAVLSNKPDLFAQKIVQGLFGESLFDLVQGKVPQFATKPDPASLRYAMGKLAVSPEEVTYVGDSDVDVFTGKNAGVEAVGAGWGFRGRKELEAAGAAFVAEDASQLLSYLLEKI